MFDFLYEHKNTKQSHLYAFSSLTMWVCIKSTK